MKRTVIMMFVSMYEMRDLVIRLTLGLCLMLSHHQELSQWPAHRD
jgi:hypothetical protein